MKKNTARLIVLAVIVMIILNGVLVSLLWAKQPISAQSERPPFEKINDFIITEMGFDEATADEFRGISQKHHDNQQQHQMRYRTVKDQLNRAMLDQQKAEADSLLNELAEIVISKEKELYRFIEEVSSITTEEEQKRFAQIFGKATRAPDYERIPMDGRTNRRPPPKR